MIKHHMTALSITGLAVALFCNAAISLPIVYTDRTSWEAAIMGSLFTETFDAVDPQALTEGTTTLGLLDVTIDTTDGVNEVFVESGGDNALGTRVSSVRGDIASSIIVETGSTLTAFGADFVSTISGTRLRATLSNGSTIAFEDHFFDPGTGFLGFTDVNPFTDVTFSSGPELGIFSAESFDMDNVSWSNSESPLAVPVPATLALFALGLAGFGWSRRRKA